VIEWDEEEKSDVRLLRSKWIAPHFPEEPQEQEMEEEKEMVSDLSFDEMYLRAPPSED
jgi:hypothetical protein